MDIELKIIPAPMQTIELNVTEAGRSSANPTVLWKARTQLPVIQTDPYIAGRLFNEEDQTKEIDIQQVIEGTAATETTPAQSIHIAIFDGDHPVSKTGEEDDATTPNRINYPVPYVDFLWEFEGERLINNEKLSLRIDDPNGLNRLYAQSVKIDTTREYNFKFIYHGKLDVKAVFIIKNKEFVCKEIRFKINQNGIDPLIDGLFYPISP
jgi:hypothetical protein